MFDDKKLDKLEKLINLVDEDYVKSDEFVEVFGVLVSLIKESNDSSEESIESLKKQAESIREVVLSERKLSRKLQEQFNNRLASFKTELENAIYEVKEILPELREAKDGVDGKDGRDGKDGKDGSPDTGEQIVEKINSLNEKAPKIDASHIKNLPQTVTTIVEQGGRGFVETPIKAGSNVTVTKDASGAWVINSTSGGAGLVDGDYGDITVGGSGTTMTIDNLAVTNAKINDVAWSKISGTPTTLSGYGITDAVDGAGVANRIAYWSDGNTVDDLDTATYPDLTELSYVKGVTSAIQTQINGKQASDATLTALAGLTIAADSLTIGTGADAFSQTTFAANTFPAKASTGNLVAKTITDFGLSLVDDADASAARTTLGLGTAAVVATDLADLNEATIEAAIDTLANLTSIQGRTVTLADAGTNAFFGWDDTAGAYENLSQAEARTILGLGTAAYVATDLSDLNEATIETAIDTLANLTSIQGRTITLSDAGFDVLAGWDDSAGAYKNFLLADITAEASPASGDYFLMYGAEGDLRKVNFDDMPSGGGGATTALDNLASVAINTTLVSDTDNTDDLGTSLISWRNAYIGTGIELGHASDTTLTRSSAGNVAIEGNVIYRAGGTDVPVADGGTGLSTFGGTGTLLYTSSADNLTSSANLTYASNRVAMIGTNSGVVAEYSSGTNFVKLFTGSTASLFMFNDNNQFWIRGGSATSDNSGTGAINMLVYGNDVASTANDINFDGGLMYLDYSATSIGINTTSPSAKLHIIGTTEQLRLGYDTSNYLSATINSTGSVTFNLTGTSPEFTFSDAVNVPDEAYGAGWNGNTEVPTKNAVYDKIETLLPLAGGTMTGNITLGENTSVDLDPALSADGKYSGICITGTAGAALSFGDLIYLSSTDSRWELADADAASTADRMLGICVLAAAGDGSATKILLHGNIRADAAFPTLTIGSPVYVGETAGDIQVAIPTGADNVIRRVGYALTADELYFAPSMDSQITVA